MLHISINATYRSPLVRIVAPPDRTLDDRKGTGVAKDTASPETLERVINFLLTTVKSSARIAAKAAAMHRAARQIPSGSLVWDTPAVTPGSGVPAHHVAVRHDAEHLAIGVNDR